MCVIVETENETENETGGEAEAEIVCDPRTKNNERGRTRGRRESDALVFSLNFKEQRSLGVVREAGFVLPDRLCQCERQGE